MRYSVSPGGSAPKRFVFRIPLARTENIKNTDLKDRFLITVDQSNSHGLPHLTNWTVAKP